MSEKNKSFIMVFPREAFDNEEKLTEYLKDAKLFNLFSDIAKAEEYDEASEFLFDLLYNSEESVEYSDVVVIYWSDNVNNDAVTVKHLPEDGRIFIL